jgi:hypothetical protein
MTPLPFHFPGDVVTIDRKRWEVVALMAYAGARFYLLSTDAGRQLARYDADTVHAWHPPRPRSGPTPQESNTGTEAA